MNEATSIVQVLGVLRPDLAAQKPREKACDLQQQLPTQKVQNHCDSSPKVIRYDLLKPGLACFVEMRGKVFPATVIRHFESEQVVQVQTEAAALIRAGWKCMSFRWQDGKADACRWDGRLILDEDEAVKAATPRTLVPAIDPEPEPEMPPELTSYVEPAREFWWND